MSTSASCVVVRVLQHRSFNFDVVELTTVWPTLLVECRLRRRSPRNGLPIIACAIAVRPERGRSSVVVDHLLLSRVGGGGARVRPCHRSGSRCALLDTLRPAPRWPRPIPRLPITARAAVKGVLVSTSVSCVVVCMLQLRVGLLPASPGLSGLVVACRGVGCPCGWCRVGLDVAVGCDQRRRGIHFRIGV